MKRLFRYIITGLIVLLFAGFLTLSHLVNREIVDEGEMDNSNLAFFYETYEENREQFRILTDLLKKQYKDVEVAKYLVKSDTDSDLSIDTLYIPSSQHSQKLFIISSGVHGIEGFTGSAVQRYFMSKLLNAEVLQNMSLLFIHSINPHGFKHERRVSENNVDMNRNFDVDKALFERKNQGYEKIYNFLNPQKKVRAGYFRNTFFFAKTAQYLLRYGMKNLRQAALEGQYEFGDGIFYGGKDFEPQKEWLEQLISEKVTNCEFVFLIDLHTGYGDRGRMHLFPLTVKNERTRKLIEEMFKGYVIDWPDPDEAIYEVTGAFTLYVENLISANRQYIQMGFEFGTLNSRTTMGAIHSLQNMVLENQGFHYGYASDRDEEIVKRQFREMFFPSSKIWRSEAIQQAGEIFPVLLNRYAAISN